jgi:hypothetical protein
MWRDPYLETCCRSALHRTALAGDIGRPGGLKDGRCLERLRALGLVTERPDKRYVTTAAGAEVHDTQILRVPRRTGVSD